MILQCKTDDFFFDGKKENEWNYWNRGNLQVQWRGCILCDLYFYGKDSGHEAEDYHFTRDRGGNRDAPGIVPFFRGTRLEGICLQSFRFRKITLAGRRIAN